ncbi:MAG: macrolide 2-phosphotransferase [Rhodoglobus sp.]|nr:macrolide 2-phosphotransferase [Rhodoglobus sp.]
MARSHLTLAALATSAVAGLDVAAAASFGAPGGDFDSAILTGRDGRHWIVRVPRSPKAESEQSADLVALRALSAGVRTRLPFAVSAFAGQAPVDGTRAIVYEFVYGTKVALTSYPVGPDGIAASVGRAIAAVHSLPTSFVADAGLPVLTAGECLRSCVSTMDRAAATGLLPAALIGRWERASEDPKLWQFQPTVINGALSADSFLSADDGVTGVLGWQDLRVGDPASDLQWVLGARNDGVVESVFAAYARVRGEGDRHVRQRAMFYAELEVAKWLLHGTETKSTEIVDDAVAMLTGLVDSIRNDVMNPIGAQTMPTMAVDEVEAFLARSERAV